MTARSPATYGQQLYRCTLCISMFANSDELASHMSLGLHRATSSSSLSQKTPPPSANDVVDLSEDVLEVSQIDDGVDVNVFTSLQNVPKIENVYNYPPGKATVKHTKQADTVSPVRDANTHLSDVNEIVISDDDDSSISTCSKLSKPGSRPHVDLLVDDAVVINNFDDIANPDSFSSKQAEQSDIDKLQSSRKLLHMCPVDTRTKFCDAAVKFTCTLCDTHLSSSKAFVCHMTAHSQNSTSSKYQVFKCDRCRMFVGSLRALAQTTTDAHACSGSTNHNRIFSPEQRNVPKIENVHKHLPSKTAVARTKQADTVSPVNATNSHSSDVEIVISDDDDSPIVTCLKSAKCDSSNSKQTVPAAVDSYSENEKLPSARKSVVVISDAVNKFTCRLCNLHLLSSEAFTTHMKTHFGDTASSESQISKCDRCGMIFSSLQGLARHAKDAHASPAPTKRVQHVSRKSRPAAVRRKLVSIQPYPAPAQPKATVIQPVFVSQENVVALQPLHATKDLTSNATNVLSNCTTTLSNSTTVLSNSTTTLSNSTTVLSNDTTASNSDVTASSSQANATTKNMLNVDQDKTSKSTSENHLKIPPSFYACEFCSEIFTVRRQLILHRWRHHTNRQELECTLCNRLYKKHAELRSHVKNYHCGDLSGTHINCLFCKRTFRSEADRDKHVMDMHPKKIVHKCSMCKKCFATMSMLKTHQKKAHRIATGKTRKAKKIKEPYICATCSKKFRRKHHLAKHMQHHTGERSFACSYCDKKFTTKYILADHIQRHLGTFPRKPKYSCDFCDETFVYHARLNLHLLYHTGEAGWECTACASRYRSKYEVFSHMLTSHDAGYVEPREQKNTVGQSASQPIKVEADDDSSGRNEMPNRRCTSVRPSIKAYCYRCDVNFTNEKQFVDHMQSAHGFRSSNSYQCNQCSQRCTSLKALATHKRKHANSAVFRHRCSVCELGFLSSSGLSRHMTLRHESNVGTANFQPQKQPVAQIEIDRACQPQKKQPVAQIEMDRAEDENFIKMQVALKGEENCA